MSPWAEPQSVVPGGVFVDLASRWQRLAQRWPAAVRVLDPGAGEVAGEDSVGVAPALVDAVDALPGVALGGVVIDWPRGVSQRWPELGEDRFGYQPVWVVGREAVVVRIDAAGRAGEVLHVRGDGGIDLEAGGVDVIASDVVAWWQILTAWAEQTVPALVDELGEEIADPEELEMVLEEALEQDFTDWLAAA